MIEKKNGNHKNWDIRDLLLYRLFDCHSEEDHEKIFMAFDKIKMIFGENVYFAVIDELVSFMRDVVDHDFDCILLHLYQYALNFATKELVGPEIEFESWDDHLGRSKNITFHWDYKFEASDFDAFNLISHKINEAVKVFNKFLHE